MQVENVFYLPSGRIFLADLDGYKIEFTEMRDVSVDGKDHEAVRNTMDPRVIWKHLVPYQDKWLLTVSTEKGCRYNCKFCDVAPLPYRGVLSTMEIIDQIQAIITNTPYVRSCNKVKIGFARMGEPANNIDNVFEAIRALPMISMVNHLDLRWLPCFNSILPKAKPDTIARVIELKEKDCGGYLHFQISCNSTHEGSRQWLFGGAEVVPLTEIVKEVKKHKITDRSVTLNFIVMEGIEVDPVVLHKMGVTGDKFMIKLIPMNKTKNSDDNQLKTVANYKNYQKLLDLRDEFRAVGIPTVCDAVANCETAGLCCGQLAQIFG